MRGLVRGPSAPGSVGGVLQAEGGDKNGGTVGERGSYFQLNYFLPSSSSCSHERVVRKSRAVHIHSTTHYFRFTRSKNRGNYLYCTTTYSLL